MVHCGVDTTIPLCAVECLLKRINHVHWMTVYFDDEKDQNNCSMTRVRNKTGLTFYIKSVRTHLNEVPPYFKLSNVRVFKNRSL